MLRSLVQLKQVDGEAVQMGDLRVTPTARTLVVRAPRPIPIGVAWTWPAAVTVQRGEDAPTVVPVVDTTRAVLLVLSGVMMLTAFVGMAIARYRSSRR